jgi:hypothetical protein
MRAKLKCPHMEYYLLNVWSLVIQVAPIRFSPFDEYSALASIWRLFSELQMTARLKETFVSH